MRRSLSFAPGVAAEIAQLERDRDHWKAQRQYQHAQAAQRSVDDLKKLLEEERLKELDAAHAQEQAANQAAFQESLQLLLQRWHDQMQQLRAQLQGAEQQLLARQSEEEAALANAQAAMQPRPKFSPHLLNMRHIERTLAFHKEFERADKVKQHADELELLELSQQDAELGAKLEAEQARLQALHHKEREAAAKKAASALQAARQRSDHEVEQLSRRFQAAMLSLGRSQATHKLSLKQRLRGSLGLSRPSALLGLPSFNSSLTETRGLVPTSPHRSVCSTAGPAATGTAGHSSMTRSPAAAAGIMAPGRAGSPGQSAAREPVHLPAAMGAMSAGMAAACMDRGSSKRDRAVSPELRPYTRGQMGSCQMGSKLGCDRSAHGSNNGLHLLAAIGAARQPPACHCQVAAAAAAAAGHGHCGSASNPNARCISSCQHTAHRLASSSPPPASDKLFSSSQARPNSNADSGLVASAHTATAVSQSMLAGRHHEVPAHETTCAAAADRTGHLPGSQPDSPASAVLNSFTSWGFAGSALEGGLAAPAKSAELPHPVTVIIVPEPLHVDPAAHQTDLAPHSGSSSANSRGSPPAELVGTPAREHHPGRLAVPRDMAIEGALQADGDRSLSLNSSALEQVSHDVAGSIQELPTKTGSTPAGREAPGQVSLQSDRRAAHSPPAAADGSSQLEQAQRQEQAQRHLIIGATQPAEAIIEQNAEQQHPGDQQLEGEAEYSQSSFEDYKDGTV